MLRYRSILTLILVAITTLLISCSNPTPTVEGPLYTSAQLEQIQKYTDDLQIFRDRMLELPPLVQKDAWTDVASFIHGPLGELRATMSRLARTLEPTKQKQALTASKEVFEHLILIDEASQSRDRTKALRNYNEALKDFDAFLNLIPS
ncbi:MAG TPA: photosystem II protein PsbQ [Trichocoleus sp.]|jgi:photosystem II protein PsbQ